MEHIYEWVLKWIMVAVGAALSVALTVLGWIMNRQIKRVDRLETIVYQLPTRKDIDELKQGHRELRAAVAEFEVRDTKAHDRLYDHLDDMRKEIKQDVKDLATLLKGQG